MVGSLGFSNQEPILATTTGLLANGLGKVIVNVSLFPVVIFPVSIIPYWINFAPRFAILYEVHQKKQIFCSLI